MPGSAIFGSNLVDDIYSDVVDSVRQDLLPEMGIRPYQTAIVTRTWTGLTIGDGTYTDEENVFSPIPRVHNWNDSILTKLHPCGEMEEGDVVISELSLSYTHDEIGGARGLNDAQLPGNVQRYILIFEGNGQQTPPRYFTQAHAPYSDREETMGWICHLRLMPGIVP